MDAPRSFTWITLESRRPVESIVAEELGTTLRSLPLVILNRWTEWPDAAENAVYNSSLLALGEISTSLGSLRMGLPVCGLALRLRIFVVPPRALVDGTCVTYPLAQ